jgi:hypothetical protein
VIVRQLVENTPSLAFSEATLVFKTVSAVNVAVPPEAVVEFPERAELTKVLQPVSE